MRDSMPVRVDEIADLKRPGDYHPNGSAPLEPEEKVRIDAELERLALGQLAEILDRIGGWLRRFIVFPNEHGSIAVTLFIAFTYVVDLFDVAPYFLVTASEIASGKTKLLEMMAALCHKPELQSSGSPATLFRTIQKEHPTFFIDEADNVWTGRKDEKASELVALLNAGHRRGFKAKRMGGPTRTTLEEFDVFCPKVIAGAFPDIGAIPDALRSRSVHLRMKRKLPSESVDRWTRQVREAEKATIENLKTLLIDTLNESDLGSVEVGIVEELSDRDFDIWEPLLAIAGRAGGHWPRASLDAALALCSDDASQTVPLRIVLLGDLGELWRDRSDDPFILTSEILDFLHAMEERPWRDFYGAPLTPHKLGRLLSSYGIESKLETSKNEPGTERKRRKGYYRQDLDDTWARYSRQSSPSSPSSPTSHEQALQETLESLESLRAEELPDPFEEGVDA